MLQIKKLEIKKMDNMYELIRSLKDQVETMLKRFELKNVEDTTMVSSEDSEVVRTSLDVIKTTTESLKNAEVGDEVLDNKVSQITEAVEKVSNILSKGKDKLIPDFSLQAYYDFLDTLSLLEESALLHILIFIFLLLCIFSLFSVFFGNEIIKYFKLEERYPKLELYFKLRTKFQRYYLIWNIFTMLVVCIIGIGIDLLLLY
uniref:LAGLIDADG endonuclease n=1 Tax=Lenzites betulinus TaxID=5632 RepID=UPI003002BED8|nr:LAGLIDADG endonuclease [Lenzites betulinus]